MNYEALIALAVTAGLIFLSGWDPPVQPAKKRGNTYILRHRLRTRVWLRFIPLAISLVGTYALLRREDPLWVGLTLMSFYPLCLLCVPLVIRFDPKGIWQRSRLGRTKYLSWKDISRVGEGLNFTILIYDTEGVVRIEHTIMHTGQDELLDELEKRNIPMWFKGFGL